MLLLLLLALEMLLLLPLALDTRQYSLRLTAEYGRENRKVTVSYQILDHHKHTGAPGMLC